MSRFSIGLVVLLCASCTFSQKYRSKIEVVSLHNNVDVSNVEIAATLPDGYVQVLWSNGAQQSEPPNAGVEGVEWMISYGNFSGKFIDSKLIMNEPVYYNFLFNQNQDSSLFVQIKMDRGILGPNSTRIHLKSDNKTKNGMQK